MDKCLECVCKTCARRESDICPDGNPCVCFCANGRTKIKHYCKVHKNDARTESASRACTIDGFSRFGKAEQK